MRVYLISILNVLFVNCIYGQYEKVNEEILFQSKLDNPVKTEVLEQNGKYVFYANSRSYYPYQLTISFNELNNLYPAIYSRDFKVMYGRNQLFSIAVKDEKLGHSYQYKFSYTIGTPSKDVDLKFPYLIPLNTNTSFSLVNFLDEMNTYYIDFFKINKGDTIYNMRKGMVVAVPNMFHDADRISSNQSLEIMHKDGTIMIYENLEPKSIFTRPGQIVYPGQPLGIINDKSILEVHLYMIQKDNKLQNLNIYYSLEGDKVEKFSEDFKNISIVHSMDIIMKEMTKREKSQLKNTKERMKPD